MDSSLPTIGESLGEYRIGAVLGSGGQGTVYQAERRGQGGIGTQLAIKILPAIPGDSDTQERRYRDFLHEAYLLTRMHHPHIVTIFEVNRLSGFPCIVMELVEGEGLDQVIKRRRARGDAPTALWCLKVISQAAEALRYAHELVDRDGSPLRVIHRDIKPANMLLGPGGSLKLTDFGLARSDHGERDETEAGILKGSVKYMSPEQARCDELGITTDFFSLGVVLYEMLTLESPFGLPPDAGVSAYLIAIQQGAREVAQRIGWISEWSPPIGALLGGMLAYDPAQRFQSAEALISALEDARRRVDDTLRWGLLPADDGTYIGEGSQAYSPPGASEDTLQGSVTGAPLGGGESAITRSPSSSSGLGGAYSGSARRGASSVAASVPVSPQGSPSGSSTALGESHQGSPPANKASQPSPWLMLLGGVLLGGGLMVAASLLRPPEAPLNQDAPLQGVRAEGSPGEPVPTKVVSLEPSAQDLQKPTAGGPDIVEVPTTKPDPAPPPSVLPHKGAKVGKGEADPVDGNRAKGVTNTASLADTKGPTKVAAKSVTMSFNGMPAVLLEVNGVERGEAGPFSRITLELAPGAVSLRAKDVATGELVWTRKVDAKAGSRWRCQWRGGDRWLWRQGRAVVESLGCEMEK